jgi:Ca2+-transporting ATPase
LILTDDNFATIVSAVEYGRSIYDNLIKYIRFQMGALVAFIATFLGAAFFSILGGNPFGTIMVLWINFLVQVPIAIALGFDEPSPGLMKRKPRPLSQPVLSRNQWVRIVFLGTIIASVTLLIEAYYSQFSPDQAITMGFVVFSLLSIALGLSARSETESMFSRDFLPGWRQLGLYGTALFFVLLGTFLLRTISGTSPLTTEQWLICLFLTAGFIVIEEITKFFIRLRRK